MKGVLHYPIKEIYQCTYTDLVIIAKYDSSLFAIITFIVQVRGEDEER